jgi:uncharacterized protein
MTLKEQLTQDLKAAMKHKAQTRLATIRLVRTAIKNREVELMRELEDEEVLREINRLVKQAKDSIEQFEQGGRADLVEEEQARLQILQTYLPQQMTEAEISALVQEAIAAVEAASMKDMGRVMQYIMPKVQGRADGKLVNQLVKAQLQ